MLSLASDLTRNRTAIAKRTALRMGDALRSRWLALAVLFVIRLAMAFQFQSVAAVAPLLGDVFGVSFADIGWLIGLYFAPGLVLALPGGAIGKRFGDRPTVMASLLLMLIGEVAMALSPSWFMQIAGRLVSGAGGVVFNVQMTKMVAEWFAGREIATAMAIYINSWPAGIALSLVFLPPIATAFGVAAVYLVVAVSIALGLVFFAAAYPRPRKITTTAAGSSWPDRNTFIALIAAGLLWGLFNVGFTTIFSFGPSMLAERGWSISAACSVISIVLWLAVISVPLGGYLADRTGQPNLVLVGGCIIFAVLMIILPRGNAVISTVTAIGLLSGLPVGPIMSLPARILKPETRAIGMGIFYTLNYATMMLGPIVAGAVAKSTGNAASAFDFGTIVILACPTLLWAFNRLPEAQPKIA